MKHPVWNNLKFPWIEGEQRRNGKEEQEGRGEFFLYAKFTIFLVYKVLEDDQSCRLLDSRLFFFKPKVHHQTSQVWVFLAGSHKTLIMGIQRSKTEFSPSQGGVQASRKGGGHVSLFRHGGKMSVLSYQSRSENWGDFL